MVDYSGNRDLETLSRFLDNGGVLPEETVDEDEDEDENKDIDGSKESKESDEDDDKVCIFTSTLFFSFSNRYTSTHKCPL